MLLLHLVPQNRAQIRQAQKIVCGYQQLIQWRNAVQN